MTTCKKCKGKGFILNSDNSTSLCVCQKTLQFKKDLEDRGFRLGMIKPWDVLNSPAVHKIKSLSYKDIFLIGKSGETVFYSYMTHLLSKETRTRIFSSSELTEIFLSKGSEYQSKLSYLSLGIVLGFDLTNSIQGKVMADFLFFRKSNKNWQTVFWLPYNSMRRLETEYGDVFSEYIKEGDLNLVEVK